MEKLLLRTIAARVGTPIEKGTAIGIASAEARILVLVLVTRDEKIDVNVAETLIVNVAAEAMLVVAAVAAAVLGERIRIAIENVMLNNPEKVCEECQARVRK